jgi:glycosyltransferase involved in cell wall biosynthesis
MNIVMLTNTYLPHVGGVARSVEAFARHYRRLGHQVLIVAPVFENQPEKEDDVIRIPAIQHFNGSDFSVVLPVSGLLTDRLDDFGPDIVHAHHPFLLGMTALRIARFRELPLVFTHHTLYEQYTHYVPGDSPALKRFVIELATRYANLADQVFAPSESIADLIRSRGVTASIAVVPTGVEVEQFRKGDGRELRQRFGLAADDIVVGHLGRLAPEKNLAFLADAVARFLQSNDRTSFLIVGDGTSAAEIRSIFEDAGLGGRLHMTGSLQGQALIDAYHAMDVFAFASKSETQGMVLTEAMAAGLPVVALDASGAREVVRDKVNGRLLGQEDIDAFAGALTWVADRQRDQQAALNREVEKTAERFSMTSSARKAIDVYQRLCGQTAVSKEEAISEWEKLLHLIEAEWDIVKSVADAVGAGLDVGGAEKEPQP